jgi:hypothetical protein
MKTHKYNEWWELDSLNVSVGSDIPPLNDFINRIDVWA